MHKLMKCLLLAGVLAFSTSNAEVWQARYGVAETFDFKLYNADGTLDVDEADGGTEVSLSCNEGAETTATNDFVDEGTFYSIALTATEMQCKRIAVVVAATTTEVFFIQTDSNASAMRPTFEANVASVTDGAIVAADLASDAINASKIAADVSAEFSAAVFTVNATQISGDSGVADRLEAMLDSTCGSYPELGITRGVGCTAQAYTAGTPSLTLDASAAFGDNALQGATILICGSTQGYCQPAAAVSNVGSTDVVTLREALPVAATGTITYTIFGTAAGSGSVTIATGGITNSSFAAGAIDASAIADNAIDAGAIAADAIGASEIAADAIGSSELASGAIGAAEIGTAAIDADAIATDAFGAAELAAGAVTEIQTGLATSSSITTLDGKIDTVDTVADAIKVKTDQLTFGVTNQLNVNVESMNATEVLGAGTAADPWNGE